MKPKNQSLPVRKASGSLCRISRIALVCAVALAAHATNGLAESDDFNDGDDVGWTRYNPLSIVGVPAVFSFPNGGYRIQTTAPSPNPTTFGNARAGSYRSTSYTDFYISVDIVNWNDSLPQAAGILARIGTPGLGTTTGFAFTWTRGTSATDGDMDISRITGEVPTGAANQASANDKYHFVPGRVYRMVFIGKGSALEGRVYELPDVTTPKVIVTASDPAHPSGVSGVVVYDNSSMANNLTDTTFDNFLNLDVEPPRLQISELNGFGDVTVSWPLASFNEGFKLQYVTSLPAAPADWLPIPDDLLLEVPPDRIQYTTSRDDAPAKHFRLRRP